MVPVRRPKKTSLKVLLHHSGECSRRNLATTAATEDACEEPESRRLPFLLASEEAHPFARSKAGVFEIRNDQLHRLPKLSRCGGRREISFGEYFEKALEWKSNPTLHSSCTWYQACGVSRVLEPLWIGRGWHHEQFSSTPGNCSRTLRSTRFSDMRRCFRRAARSLILTTFGVWKTRKDLWWEYMDIS